MSAPQSLTASSDTRALRVAPVRSTARKTTSTSSSSTRESSQRDHPHSERTWAALFPGLDARVTIDDRCCRFSHAKEKAVPSRRRNTVNASPSASATQRAGHRRDNTGRAVAFTVDLDKNAASWPSIAAVRAAVLTELERLGWTFVSGYILERAEERFYTSIGFRNGGYFLYMVDQRRTRSK